MVCHAYCVDGQFYTSPALISHAYVTSYKCFWVICLCVLREKIVAVFSAVLRLSIAPDLINWYRHYWNNHVIYFGLLIKILIINNKFLILPLVALCTELISVAHVPWLQLASFQEYSKDRVVWTSPLPGKSCYHQSQEGESAPVFSYQTLRLFDPKKMGLVCYHLQILQLCQKFELVHTYDASYRKCGIR